MVFQLLKAFEKRSEPWVQLLKPKETQHKLSGPRDFNESFLERVLFNECLTTTFIPKYCISSIINHVHIIVFTGCYLVLNWSVCFAQIYILSFITTFAKPYKHSLLCTELHIFNLFEDIQSTMWHACLVAKQGEVAVCWNIKKPGSVLLTMACLPNNFYVLLMHFVSEDSWNELFLILAFICAVQLRTLDICYQLDI